MIESTMNDIEGKIKSLQDELQKVNSYINDIGVAIKKLRNDRKISQFNMNTMSGAIQAYAESIRLIKESFPVAHIQVTEDGNMIPHRENGI